MRDDPVYGDGPKGSSPWTMVVSGHTFNPPKPVFLLKTDEKRSRIYYQSLVYDVCNLLEAHFGGFVVCGTSKIPCTEVQERIEQLIKDSQSES